MGLRFVDGSGYTLEEVYFKDAIYCSDPLIPPIVIEQFLIAGVFTGDLDFYSKFLGHQGASARLLCMSYLAMQDQLKNGFLSGGKSSQVKKSTIVSIKKMYGI